MTDPGIPNSILNEDYISQFNNNCTPYTALSLSVNNISDASCFCDGSATIQASGVFQVIRMSGMMHLIIQLVNPALRRIIYVKGHIIA